MADCQYLYVIALHEDDEKSGKYIMQVGVTKNLENELQGFIKQFPNAHYIYVTETINADVLDAIQCFVDMEHRLCGNEYFTYQDNLVSWAKVVNKLYKLQDKTKIGQVNALNMIRFP